MTTISDNDWLTADRGMSRRRLVLLLLLAASVIFLAGTQVQKNFGTSESATAAGAPTGFPTAMPEGMSGMPAAAGDGAEEGDDDAAEESAVVGTLTSTDGDTWIVTDLGGDKHTITVTDATRVREERTVELNDAKAGSTVDVTGTKNDKGDVSATSITLR